MHMYMSDDNADLCTDIISAASGSVILLKRVKPKLSTYRKKYHLSSISESKLLLYFYHMSWSSVKACLFFTLIHSHTHIHTHTHTYKCICKCMYMPIYICANLHTKHRHITPAPPGQPSVSVAPGLYDLIVMWAPYGGSPAHYTIIYLLRVTLIPSCLDTGELCSYFGMLLDQLVASCHPLHQGMAIYVQVNTRQLS